MARIFFHLLAALCVIATGCATAGKHKKLGFLYQAEDNLFGTASVSLAIARGARAELIVSSLPQQTPNRATNKKEPTPRYFPPSTVKSVTLAAARSSDQQVVAVVKIDRDRVTIEGRRAGKAEVTVHTATTADSIDLSVAEVHKIELAHLAGKQQLTGAAFVKGGTARFMMSRLDEKGRHLVGHGLKPAVAVEPAGSASVSAGGGDHGHLDVRLHTAGKVRLLPKNGATLELVVVEAHQIHALEVQAWDLSKGKQPWPGSLGPKDKKLLYLWAALADGTPVLGTDGAAHFLSLTPHICSLRPARRWLGDGFFGVEALAPGECQLQAKLGPQTHIRRLAVRDRKTKAR